MPTVSPASPRNKHHRSPTMPGSLHCALLSILPRLCELLLEFKAPPWRVQRPRPFHDFEPKRAPFPHRRPHARTCSLRLVRARSTAEGHSQERQGSQGPRETHLSPPRAVSLLSREGRAGVLGGARAKARRTGRRAEKSGGRSFVRFRSHGREKGCSLRAPPELPRSGGLGERGTSLGDSRSD